MKIQNSNLAKFNTFFSLYGVKKSSKLVLTNKLGVNSRINVTFIKQKNFNYLSNLYLDALVGNKLQASIKENISFMKNNRTYKGLRHKVSLPVRGQRTHTNAKTCKKKFRKKA
jgi:small subunit ribosomal protein S13